MTTSAEARFIDPGERATLVSGVRVIDIAADIDRVADVLVAPGRVTLDPAAADVPADARRIDGAGKWLLPGLIDLQVHMRQPGFEHKEDIGSGSRAALAGGVTTVVVMPNTKPTLDTPEAVAFQGEQAARVHGVRVLVAAAATEGIAGKKLTDHGALQRAGAVAVTDDGYPLQDDALMRGSLEQCAACDLLFMQHAEDMTVSGGEPMTRGATSEALGVPGQPADAEGAMVERDVALVAETGARYHVLHLSTARSLQAVRAAKAKGLAVSCEASPHHLLLTDAACAGGDTHFKMNPPLRSEADRQVLLAGLADRSIDAVATDHAPHSAEEKARSFSEAPFGVIGLETAFAALLAIVGEGVIDERRAVELMTAGPARVLRRPELGSIGCAGSVADVCLVDPRRAFTVSEDTLFGRSKNSAFLGREMPGRVVATFVDGRLRYRVG